MSLVAPSVGVGASLVGRVIDPFGRALDGRPAPFDLSRIPLEPPRMRWPRLRALSALVRPPVTIDPMLALKRGQRVSLVAPHTLARLTALGLLASHASCQTCVVALVGERGSAVRHFLERTLTPRGARARPWWCPPRTSRPRCAPARRRPRPSSRTT